jgi:predicted nucleotide-binding protein (sugar kinase/HSP70/actin superfamily)
MFGEWYQKTNKTGDTNKLTLLAFKIIILHNTRLATFIKLLETVSKLLVRNRSQNSRTAAIQERVTAVLRSLPTAACADSFQKLYERCQPCVVKDDDYFEGQ